MGHPVCMPWKLIYSVQLLLCLHNRYELRVSLSPTFWKCWVELFGAKGKFGLWAGAADQETAHEEFFVCADGPNLTGNQIYCICRSRTRRRYTDGRNIIRYCFAGFCDNFGCRAGPVRVKSVKVIWIFKVVERSIVDILILFKDFLLKCERSIMRARMWIVEPWNNVFL